MERLHLLLVIGLLQVFPALASAQASLPRSLTSCDDFDTIVRNYSQWNIEDAERASDGGWNEAVIRADRTPDSRGLSVRESDIDLFVKCWEEDVRTGGEYSDYNLKMWDATNDLFPPTERVALALTGLAERLISDPRQDVSYALSALALLAVACPAESERERIARIVTPKLRGQWWQCWESKTKVLGVDGATHGCDWYSDATSRWLLGLVQPSKEVEAQRAEEFLRRMLDQSDPNERQIALLASFDRNSLWDATTRHGLRSLRDPDRNVRLMAVRLADEARLNEDGESYDPELRRALQEIARRDPDAEIRKEANRILQLEPYLGPG